MERSDRFRQAALFPAGFPDFFCQFFKPIRCIYAGFFFPACLRFCSFYLIFQGFDLSIIGKADPVSQIVPLRFKVFPFPAADLQRGLRQFQRKAV